MMYLNLAATYLMNMLYVIVANVNVGQNAFNWFQKNIKYFVLMAICFIGGTLAFKKEFTKLAAVGVVALIAVVCVWNPTGVQKFLLGLANKILGLG